MDKPCDDLESIVENIKKIQNSNGLHPHQRWSMTEEILNERLTVDVIKMHDLDLLSNIFQGIKGCGDSMCIIEKPKGMVTNGGCRCHTDRSKASIIMQRVAGMRNRLMKELNDED